MADAILKQTRFVVYNDFDGTTVACATQIRYANKRNMIKNKAKLNLRFLR